MKQLFGIKREVGDETDKMLYEISQKLQYVHPKKVLELKKTCYLNKIFK